MFYVCRLPQILPSLCIIPDTLSDAEIRALWGPKHHLQDFLFCFMMKIVYHDTGCMSEMFKVVILLQNKFGASLMVLCVFLLVFDSRGHD